MTWVLFFVGAVVSFCVRLVIFGHFCDFNPEGAARFCGFPCEFCVAF